MIETKTFLQPSELERRLKTIKNNGKKEIVTVLINNRFFWVGEDEGVYLFYERCIADESKGNKNEGMFREYTLGTIAEKETVIEQFRKYRIRFKRSYLDLNRIFVFLLKRRKRPEKLKDKQSILEHWNNNSRRSYRRRMNKRLRSYIERSLANVT